MRRPLAHDAPKNGANRNGDEMANLNPGDRVVCKSDLGRGVKPGMKGTVTKVASFHNGWFAIRWDNGVEISDVRRTHLESA